MLNSLNLYEKDGRYFLNAEYLYEDDKGKYRMLIPAIALPFRDIDQAPIINSYHGLDGYSYMNVNGHQFNLYNGSCFTEKTGKIENVQYAIETLEEKTHEMTISEIEKKLGYKIKIVGEKEKTND